MARIRPLLPPGLGTLLSLGLFLYASTPPGHPTIGWMGVLLAWLCAPWLAYSTYCLIGPYRFGIILLSLTLLGSAFGALCVYHMLDHSSGGDPGIAWLVGMFATTPALATGLLAAALFYRARREQPERFFARAFWLPASVPALVEGALTLLAATH